MYRISGENGMKKIILGILLCVFVMHPIFSKTKVTKFNPKSTDYTNVVQDIAVFQEICQSGESGHYTSKMYDFDFRHNYSGKCVLNSPDSFISVNIVLDDEAKHVVKTMKLLNGHSIVYDISMKQYNGHDNYYKGYIST
jgi:hypothetical protein